MGELVQVEEGGNTTKNLVQVVDGKVDLTQLIEHSVREVRHQEKMETEQSQLEERERAVEVREREIYE